MKYLSFVFFFCFSSNILGNRIIQKDQNGERVGNPDDLAEIVRPCPTFDLNCIRKFFSTHGHCTKSFGPVPDPIVRAQANYYTPSLNASATDLNQQLRGINNGRIEEFYINKETDNLVIAVEFRNVTLTIENTYIIFHRRAREAVVTLSPVFKNYQSVIVTAIIPEINDLKIKRAECTAFVNDQLLIIGPQGGESSDPQVQTTLAQVPAKNQIVAQELLLTDAFYFIITYIQYNICDFGLFTKI